MRIWQVDFYRRPLRDPSGQVLWELLICNSTRTFEYEAFCPQSQANADWLVSQLQLAGVEQLPELMQVFRPQSLSLIETAGLRLGIAVEPTRRTFALKQWLQERAQLYLTLDNYTGEPFNPKALDKPPPVPISDNLLGEQWRFATLPSGDIAEVFARPIPVLNTPEFLLPINLGLSSTVPVPGVVIDGGRQSMRLARWLEDARPVALNYIAGAPAGLVLDAGLIDRWIVATFEDNEVKASTLR